MRIGVFGGSFDPVHVAHLTVAEVAAELLGLEQVRFVPAAIQPFKPEGHFTETPHRIAMLQLAVTAHASFLVDLREIERGGVSYTVDTLAGLRRDFPDDELFFLVGADAARDLARWRDAARLGEFAHIVAMSRAGEIPPSLPEITHTITVPSIDVSSTAVRKAARARKSLDGLVPDTVAEYIGAHDVYDSVE